MTGWVGQYQAARIVDALIASEVFDVHYVTRNAAPEYHPSGYTLTTIRKPFGTIRNGYLFLDAPPLLKALREIKPDIIYTRIGCAYTGITAYYAMRNNCKLFWHISSDSNTVPPSFRLSRSMIPDYIDRKIFEYGIANASHIIAQTITQAEQLKKNYGRVVTEIIANFHPSPTEALSKNKKIKIVWIANLKPVKQPEIFIQLANDFGSAPDLEFIMIGAMQGSQQWKANIATQMHSAKKLKYLGFIPQDKVNSILAQSHILVNTSKWEGFTNTFIQAWMRKMPVVKSNVNPDNVFDDQKLGFFSGNYSILRKHIEMLAHDDQLRNRMGEHAYAYADAASLRSKCPEVNISLQTGDRAYQRLIPHVSSHLIIKRPGDCLAKSLLRLH